MGMNVVLLRTETDLELVAAAQGTDSDLAYSAFERLFRRHAEPLRVASFRHMVRAGLPHAVAAAAADDVVQEVFIQAGLRGGPGFFPRFRDLELGPDAFRRYLVAFRHRLTAHRIGEYWRQWARETSGTSIAAALPDAEAGLYLEELARTLDSVDWTLIALHEQGVGFDELSRLTGLTEVACRQRASRARRLLRARADQEVNRAART
jgi:DNA-directed RNA polymerase specialized sigma24 family protein